VSGADSISQLVLSYGPWLQDKVHFIKADVSDYMKEAAREVGWV
jgi:hypothetical protein